jgi:hypothetical protein
MEETYRRLEEELDRRMVEAKKFASFYKFENEGDEVAGKLLYTRKIRREEGEEDTVWVIETFGGEQYTLPSYAYLQAALADAEPGDYVKIRYAGEGKGGRGRSRPKLFDVAVLPKEEAEALLEGEPPREERASPKKAEAPKPKEGEKPEEPKKPEEMPAEKPIEEKATERVEAKPEKKPAEKPKPTEKVAEKPKEVKLPEKAQLEKAESMLRTFAEFYGEVPVRTVEERLRRAGVEVPLDELLAKVPVLKREGDVLKRA